MGNSNIYKGNQGIVGVLIVSQSKRYDDIGTVRYRTAHKSKMTHGLGPVRYSTCTVRDGRISLFYILYNVELWESEDINGDSDNMSR